MSGTPAAIAALNGARSRAVGAPPAMRRRAVVGVDGRAAEAGEVLGGRRDAAGQPAARPRPTAGAARARVAARTRGWPAPRPSTDGTSATGASVTLMPGRAQRLRRRRARPAPGPGRPGAAAGGAQATLRIAPPSWSVQTIGVAAARARRAASAVSARSWPGEAMLSRNRIAPAAQPLAQDVGARRPAPSCPGSAARRACRPGAAASAGRRRPSLAVGAGDVAARRSRRRRRRAARAGRVGCVAVAPGAEREPQTSATAATTASAPTAPPPDGARGRH